jgi:hypothetical protein
MKQKFFTLLFAVMAGMNVLFAYDVQIGNLYYNLDYTSQTAEVTYKSYINYDYNKDWNISTADIPSSIKCDGYMYAVTRIGSHAFEGCSNLKSVIIPNSVTSIENGAFYGCKSLTSVIISNSVTWIAEYAFYYCTGLTSIEIPNSVTSIGDEAFAGCNSLTSVTIPNSVTSIQNGAFCKCSGLTSISVDSNNSMYDSRENCNAIIETATNTLIAACQKTVIPNSVISIRGAFEGCSSLTSITIPNSVTNIGWNAFEGCTHLTSVTIPNSVTTIEGFAFNSCSSLISVTIPSSVTSIGDNAFSYCESLTSIEIPNSVTSIGKEAFRYCSVLASIEIPTGVTNVGNSAFEGCSNLTSVVWNAKNCADFGYAYSSNRPFYNIQKQITSFVFGTEVEHIPGYLCYGMNNLTSIDIPNSVKEIGDYAFYNCAELRMLNMGNQVQSIGAHAFENCVGVNNLNLPNTLTSIGTDAFKNTPFFATAGEWENGVCYINTCAVATKPSEIPANLVLREGTTVIYQSIFSNCSNLVSLILPEVITAIPDSAFYNCSSLTSMKIPNSVRSIGNNAFYNCSSITSVTIPNSVTSIKSDAFSGCSSLNTVNISDIAAWCKITFGSSASNPLYYAHKLYLNEELITNLIIPNSFNSIGNYTFAGCTSLKSVIIPNSVTSIGNAFGGCSSLTSVTLNTNAIVNRNSSLLYLFGSQVEEYIIGNDVTSIGNYTFYECSNLKSVTIGNSVKNIGDVYVFGGCTSLTSIIWNAKHCEGFKSKNTPFYRPSVVTTFDIREQITSFIFGNEVEYIPANLCAGMSNLTSITIPNSVTNIGNDAFAGCNNLTSVTIPNSVKEIGDYAFYDCAGLRTVNMGNQVQSIGAHAFENCTRVNNLNLPNTLTYIGTDAFKNTPFISSASEWENGVRYINTCAVGSNPDEVPTNLVLREGTTAIYQAAFKNCKKMASIALPDVLTAIPDSAFYACSRLSDIEIRNSVTKIGTHAFSGCSNLTSVTIPNSVTTIEDSTFFGCSSLKSIEIPDSVTEIKEDAFRACTSLTSVTIGQSVKYIGERAFSMWRYTGVPANNNIITVVWNAKNCNTSWNFGSQVESFTFGDKVEVIPESLCSGMNKLTSIVISNSVTEIGTKAFSSCSALKNITIGHAVETIGDNAFDQCPNVMTIYSYLETPPAINKTVFAGFRTYKGVDLYIPTGAKANYEAMNYWKDFYIIEGLPDIIDNKLHYTLDEETQTATLITSSLAELKPVIDGELVIPETVVSNGTTYTVTAIGNNAFKDNSTITTVIIPSTVTQIGDSAFYGSSLTSVVIGGIPHDIQQTLAHRSMLTDICYEIGKYAFANCKNLTEVTFPDCINSIETGAFKGCTALQTIYSKMQNPPVIDETVFEGCGNLGSISLLVPTGNEITYKNMEVWKEFFIKSLTSEGIEDIRTDANKPVKVLMDGYIYILRGEHVYDAQGKMLK